MTFNSILAVVDGAHDAWQAVRGIGADPFVTTVVVGIIWPLIQAALDRPWWTARRRVALVATASVLLAVGVWAIGPYPWAVQLVATQAANILGVAWVVYQLLSRITIGGESVLEWVGVLTPGGGSRGRHEAEEET